MIVYMYPGNGRPFRRPAVCISDSRWRETGGYRGIAITADMLRLMEREEDLSEVWGQQ